MPGQLDRIKQQAKKQRLAGNLQKAKALYEQFLKAFPSDAEASLDLGDVYMKLEDFESAVRLYAKMLEKRADNPLVLSNLGGALLRQGKPHDARAMLEYALELDPKNIFARINLGGVLQAQGDLKKALENALEAVSLDPTHPLAFNNLGSAFSDLAMFAEAKHAFETAAMLDPASIDALINLAGSESKLGNHQASIDRYEQVLAMLPPEATQRAEAVKFFASFEYLSLGNLEKGWEYYEGGFSPLVPLKGARTPNRRFPFPKWAGEELNGKKLIVWREQGLGDELLFASCVSDLIEAHPEAEIVFESEPRLVKVFQGSFPHILVRPYMGVTHYDSLEGQFDCHIPIGSLPYFFRRSMSNFKKRSHYLTLNPLVKEAAQKRLPNNRKLKVGICWRSGMLSPTRNLNYTMLSDWVFLKEFREDVDIVNLQYGDCENEIIDAEARFNVDILRWKDLDLKNDLESTLALVSCLDVVISVDSSPSAYAGALGIKTIYLARRGWFFLGQEGLPWFNSFVDIIAGQDSAVTECLDRVPFELSKLLENH